MVRQEQRAGDDIETRQGLRSDALLSPTDLFRFSYPRRSALPQIGLRQPIVPGKAAFVEQRPHHTETGTQRCRQEQSQQACAALAAGRDAACGCC